MRFQDKVVFITGGAIGFGRDFARAFAAEGASIVIADIDRPAADTLVSELTSQGTGAIAVTCDVADEGAVQKAVDESVAQLGGVDILINNAGKHLTRYNYPFATMDRADVRECLDVNVVGVINCSVAVLETMKQRGGGAIANISSIAGYMNYTVYGISKLAVRGLTIAFATEYAPHNIRVNAIAPGLMRTENAISDLPEELVDEYVNGHQLIHRLGEMEDITKAMLYLCSDDASFVTGETLKVAGGYPILL